MKLATKTGGHTVTRFLRLFAYAALIVAASAVGAKAQTPDTTPATKEQAVAMVQKAVAFIKAQGPEKAYAAIDDKSGQFAQGDLYIVVVGLDGTLLAFGADGERVGKNLIGFKDADGKEVVKERVELAKTEPSFWQSYKFTNPLTKTVEPKQMYCERLNETVVCGGVYQF
jgi:cytochrome c